MTDDIPDSIRIPDLKLHDQYNGHFKILDRCSHLYDAVLNGVAARHLTEDDLSLYQIALFVTFIKVNNSLRSLSSLCSRGFTEDARTMARKVLEATVSMAYVSRDPDKRTEQYWHHGVIRGYFEAKKIIKNNSYSDVVRNRYRELLPEYEVGYEEHKRLYECKANGELKPSFQWKWSGKNVMQMAKECGLDDLPVPYILYCESTHTSVADVPTYFSFEAAEFQPGMDAEEVPMLILFTVQLTTILTKLVNTAFSLELGNVIEQIETQMRQLDGDLVNGYRSDDE
jgi:hypothetical protein